MISELNDPPDPKIKSLTLDIEKFEDWLFSYIHYNMENMAGLAGTLGNKEKYEHAEKLSKGLTKTIISTILESK